MNRVWIDQADALEIKEGEEVTLMDWGNTIIRKIHKDSVSGTVTGIDADLHLAGDFKTTKWKLTWLAAVRLVSVVPRIRSSLFYPDEVFLH